MVKRAPQTLATSLIGRSRERAQIEACLAAGRHVLVEGPVGVGKTTLVSALLKSRGERMIRVDGDHRFTEQKLTGWFDPNLVLKKGYTEATFVPGPLVEAMRTGATLFINELNRLPESVQNVLLPAIDEGQLALPRLGVVKAKAGFRVVATQNPKEFVATSHLSEALLDRFEWVPLAPQSAEEEAEIVRAHLAPKARALDLVPQIVELIRRSRDFEGIRRGASVRAAIALAEVAEAHLARGATLEAAIFDAAWTALPTRIEIDPGHSREKVMAELLAGLDSDGIASASKKKS